MQNTFLLYRQVQQGTHGQNVIGSLIRWRSRKKADEIRASTDCSSQLSGLWRVCGAWEHPLRWLLHHPSRYWQRQVGETGELITTDYTGPVLIHFNSRTLFNGSIEGVCCIYPYSPSFYSKTAIFVALAIHFLFFITYIVCQNHNEHERAKKTEWENCFVVEIEMSASESERFFLSLCHAREPLRKCFVWPSPYGVCLQTLGPSQCCTYLYQKT